MKPSIRFTRWMTAALVAAIVLATVAPAAQADRRHRRYKGGDRGYTTRVVTRHHGPGNVYVVRRSSAGPAIAGFLGGLVLGATLAHAAPDGYVYDDPYCDERFFSLEIYRSHLRHHPHPRVVRVIERESGHCVNTWHDHDGDWRECDGHDRHGRGWDD
jgi:hypothetical protein